ncbi:MULTISPECIES: relaxase domain-containing protein [Auritidibacter]|uniref:relaxase domain-containing protein n=1 Tax=Auritidibacter TaxID=1160973 RepID=UPI0016A904F7|nr:MULTISPECIES: relaxase domain-containing protein [Auritidibacter]NIH72731.1 hypothetical protein [Auritidibacter ignavus]WGH80985.1 relaxase domain-containing protein [Auritidibacter ignavus]WGH85590.1 relaxase domain-containing protein [Auritidibacter ignavus]WGH87877.1 relaxase domain-containing protein [Auritidibacter ignavus]WGH90178.1 relaxase domain-containing protein [Auritidibacter ignavus]
MTIRVMSAGRRYEYLLSSVAAGDGDRDVGTPLTRYYTESECPRGTWIGSRLASLEDDHGTGLADGEAVTEDQLARLLGDGLHRITGTRLGHPFPKLQPRASASPPALRSSTRTGRQRNGMQPSRKAVAKRLRRSRATPL